MIRVGYVVYLLAIFLLWQGLAYYLNTPTFPFASIVIADIFSNYTYYLIESKTTLIIILKSLIPAIVFGYVLAFAFDANSVLKKIVNPIISFTQLVPKTALLPLFVSIPLLGYSDKTKFLIIFLISFYPVFIEVLNGLNLTSKKYLKLFQVYKATRKDTIFKLKIPSTVPFLLNGMHMSILYSILGAVTSEIIIGGDGLGFLIDDSSQRLNFVRTYGGIVVLSIFGFLILSIFSILTKKLTIKYTYDT